MAEITLRQAAQWCGGRVEEKYADLTFLGANIDSRKVEPGQLFIALVGERDGHDYIPKALEKGAAAVLCSRECGDVPAIVVEDTRLALGRIAREERKRLGMKVVGVTGSVGKSTTKEMIATVLSGTYKVEKTPVNHNNDLGMPMAILAMPEDTEVAVLEMGMNHFREIAYLADIAKPDVAVIVNIGTVHIEYLGSREGILQAKLEILEGAKEDASVIFNGDDGMLWGYRTQADRHITYFGEENDQAAVRAVDVDEKENLLRFRAVIGQESAPVELLLDGRHYVSDALAAIAVGNALGVSLEKAAEGLANFQNMAGRQEIFEVNGYTVIKDCYNASPESMKAALMVLGRRQGRRIAVLGDMLELGDCTQEEHERIGCIAAEKADMIFAFGPNAGCVMNGAVSGGMTAHQVSTYGDREKIVAALKGTVKPGDVLLFKGSHGMRLDLILDEMLKEE